MNGLHLGLLGGLIASIATIAGAVLLIIFKEYLKIAALAELRIDFFVGLLLIVTSVSLLYPNIIDKTINLSIATFFLGVLFFLLSKNILKNILETIAINNINEQKTILFILTLILRAIPIGLAAGASMNLSHTGEANSLLTILAFHNLFSGAAVAIGFLAIGFDPVITILGALTSGIVALVSGLFGGYISQESLTILSLVIAFSGGALMSTTLFDLLKFTKIKSQKISLGSSFASVSIVMLIFIVWKELL
ncbi:MAG: hypothetical protein Q7U04_04955 [Bacteriovorax sp.]|nr:hypothetical protein [Bacteriovorax sp.]